MSRRCEDGHAIADLVRSAPRRLMMILAAMLIVTAIWLPAQAVVDAPRLRHPRTAPACTTPGCTTPGAVSEGMISSPHQLGPGASSAVGPSMPSAAEPSASTLGAPASRRPRRRACPSDCRRRPRGPLRRDRRDPAASMSRACSSPSRPAATPGSGVPAAAIPRLRQDLPCRDSRPPVRRRAAAGVTISTGLQPSSLRQQLLPFTNNPDDLFAPPKADRPWKYVVLHHSATATGSYGAIDQEHRKRLGWEGCGYHFVIGNGTGSPDGQIEVAQRWSDQKHGIHCRNGKNPDVSEYGIGICLVGNLDDTPPTPARSPPRKRSWPFSGPATRFPPTTSAPTRNSPAPPPPAPASTFPPRPCSVRAQIWLHVESA